MKRIGIVCVAFCLAVVALCLGACAGTPPTETLSDTEASPLEVSLSILSKSDIQRRFGYTPAFNPYMAPPDMIVLKTKEFVVLDLVIETGVPAQIDYGYVRCEWETGGPQTRFVDKKELLNYWDGMGTLEEYNKQAQIIERSYLPHLSFKRRAGRGSYILVLIGQQKPLPRPFTVNAKFYINGKEYEFSIPVTE